MLSFLFRSVPPQINIDRNILGAPIDLKSANNIVEKIIEQNKSFAEIKIFFRIVDSESEKTLLSSSGVLQRNHENILDFLKSTSSVSEEFLAEIKKEYTRDILNKENDVSSENKIVFSEKPKEKSNFIDNHFSQQIENLKKENQSLEKMFIEKQKSQNELKIQQTKEINSLLQQKKDLESQLTSVVDNEKNLHNQHNEEVNKINLVIEKSKNEIDELEHKHLEQKKILKDKLAFIQKENEKLNQEQKNQSIKNQQEIQVLEDQLKLLEKDRCERLDFSTQDNLSFQKKQKDLRDQISKLNLEANQIQEKIEKNNNNKLKVENLIEDINIEKENQKQRKTLKILTANNLKLAIKQNKTIDLTESKDAVDIEKIKNEILQEIESKQTDQKKQIQKEKKRFEKKEQMYLKALSKKNKRKASNFSFGKLLFFFGLLSCIVSLICAFKSDIDGVFSNLINIIKSITS